MRIIEPKQAAAVSQKRKNSVMFPVMVLIAAVALFAYLRLGAKDPQNNSENVAPAVTSPQQAASEESKVLKLKIFTGEELKLFMDNLAYPNVSDVTTKPEITGVPAADERIRQLATERGYRQRAIPNTSLVDADGYLLQQRAMPDWEALKTSAQTAGLDLEISSGFRPVDEQRQIFTDRLKQAGATSASIASGKSDVAVTEVLRTTAVPGYSKHHTGFTVDFTCNGVGLHAFLNTTCGKWLNANNYENAKLRGWIPSYPEGASLQGPDPEPWEYVWVGTTSLYE